MTTNDPECCPRCNDPECSRIYHDYADDFLKFMYSYEDKLPLVALVQLTMMKLTIVALEAAPTPQDAIDALKNAMEIGINVYKGEYNHD